MILGLVIVILTDWFWVDSAIALGFGALIVFIGIKEIRKSVAGIMDEADFELLRKLISEIDFKKEGELDRPTQLSCTKVW